MICCTPASSSSPASFSPIAKSRKRKSVVGLNAPRKRQPSCCRLFYILFSILSLQPSAFSPSVVCDLNRVLLHDHDQVQLQSQVNNCYNRGTLWTTRSGFPRYCCYKPVFVYGRLRVLIGLFVRPV